MHVLSKLGQAGACDLYARRDEMFMVQWWTPESRFSRGVQIARTAGQMAVDQVLEAMARAAENR